MNQKFNHLVSRKADYFPDLITPELIESKCMNCRQPVWVDPDGCAIHQAWGELNCKPLCDVCMEQENALSRG